MFNIDRYVPKKKNRSIFRLLKFYWKRYLRWNRLKYKKFEQEKEQENLLNVEEKQYNNENIGCLFTIIIIILGFLYLPSYFEQNITYSIAMPKIVGKFDYNKDLNIISIWGLENIINEKTASLAYSEIFCMIDYNECTENRLAVTNFTNKNMMFPYHNEYKINYFGNNKLIISNDDNNVTGEIDLIAKTITFTTTSMFNEPRKIEILTDNEKIAKLEKEIIHKYLKVKLFPFIH